MLTEAEFVLVAREVKARSGAVLTRVAHWFKTMF